MNETNGGVCYEMYPLYRTTGKEGIFMRYSYEFNKIYEAALQ